MKKGSIIVSIFLLLGFSIFLIIKLLNPASSEKIKKDKVEYTDEFYAILNKGNHVISYALDLENSKIFKINENVIEEKEDVLYLNGQKLKEEANLYEYCAIYSNRLLVLPYKGKNEKFDGILIYDSYTKEQKEIEKIKDKFISLKNPIYFEDGGFNITTTLVKGNTIYWQGKEWDLCTNTLPKEYYIEEELFSIYNANAKEFREYEVLSSIMFDSYKVINKKCNS